MGKENDDSSETMNHLETIRITAILLIRIQHSFIILEWIYESYRSDIDVDNGKEYIFGTDFTLDDIVWMGEQTS